MRQNPASGAIIVMLRQLKMHGMARASGELTEQGSPAFEAALPIPSQLLSVLACVSDENSVLLRHSSRKLPLKLSTKPFCTGLPGAM